MTKIIAIASMMLSLASLADVQTTTLGNLRNTDTVVTNVAGFNDIAAEVAAWSHYWGGDDFVVTVTNYPATRGANRSPSGKMPHLYMSWRTEDADGEYQQIVWDQNWWQDWLMGEYLPTNYYNKSQMNAELAQKADRAWGYYDSTTGNYSPEGYTQISSANILIAAGLSYQQTITTEGEVWVLTSTDGTSNLGSSSNGVFRISDAEGNAVFEIVKGDKRTVGAQAGSVRTLPGYAITHLEVRYNVVSDAHPTLQVCRDLQAGVWKSEDASDCPANVTWTGSSGAWVAVVYGKVAESKLFVKATYELGGETYIRNSAPVAMTSIVIGGRTYRIGTATIDGKTVLTLSE